MSAIASGSSCSDNFVYIKRKGGTVLLRGGHQYYVRRKHDSGLTVWTCIKRKLCKGLLRIKITISSVCAYSRQGNDLRDIKPDRKLRRRETAVFIDSLPAEIIHHKPKYIYRRLSKHRYVKPKPYSQYGPPRSYGPKKTRKPIKKYNAIMSSKYPVHKKTSQKPRFRIPHSKRIPKPLYVPPIKNKKPQRALYNPSESIGFAEPPKYQEDSNSLKQKLEYDSLLKRAVSSKSTNHGHGEPPVDSYGAPIEPNLNDLALPTTQTYTPTAEESQNNYDIWKNRQNYESKPIHNEFEPVVFITPAPSVPDAKEEQNLKSYSDIYNYRLNYSSDRDKKKTLNHMKVMNQPWKGYKFSSKIEDSYHGNADDIVVGGQYAEPPARHIPKHQAVVHAYRDDDFEDGVSSATNSPYINYKNSNVAFSPQNLNDAFSIVD